MVLSQGRMFQIFTLSAEIDFHFFQTDLQLRLDYVRSYQSKLFLGYKRYIKGSGSSLVTRSKVLSLLLLIHCLLLLLLFVGFRVWTLVISFRSSFAISLLGKR